MNVKSMSGKSAVPRILDENEVNDNVWRLFETDIWRAKRFMIMADVSERERHGDSDKWVQRHVRGTKYSIG